MKGKLVIGLTGGIASGKSTVLREFRRLGAQTIDCDKIAREAVKPGQPAWKKIFQCFGKEVFRRNKILNRKKLGEIVFNNVKKRRQLELMIHPEVIKELKKKIAGNRSGLIMADIPLLFEAKLEKLVDKTVVVWTPDRIQMKRLLNREKIGPNEAVRRIQSQWPLDHKKRISDYVIDNSKTLQRTKEQVKTLFGRLTAGL